MTEAMLRFLCEQLREWGGLSEAEIRRIYEAETKRLAGEREGMSDMDNWYAVTDDSHHWDTPGVCIVLAAGPEEAVQLALDVWKADGTLNFDSAELKVARMTTIGSQGVQIVGGDPVRGPFSYYRS
jgi:hypothetical protein